MINQISVETLIEAYTNGMGTTDGIRIFKENGRPLGYVTDLRTKYAQAGSRERKEQERRERIKAERAEKMPEAVAEMISFLENNLKGAEVFKNITQPNVKVNDCTCYVTVDPIDQNHRLGIMHSHLSSSEMASLIEGFSISYGNTECHILWNGLSRDDIVETINKVCYA
ncbi:inhibitor of host transcription [Serratia phage 4S]|nr:inhibitor of host transcription [Serratia phage 4S]